MSSFIRDDYWVFLLADSFSLFHLLDRDNGDKGTVVPAFTEFHPAVDQRKEGMILSHADIQSGIVAGAPLTNDNIACFGKLSAVYLNSKPFAVRFAAVG